MPDRPTIRRLLRPPAVATPARIGRTLALDFGLAGSIGILATFWPATSGHRHTDAIRLLGVLVLLATPALLTLRRKDWWLVNALSLSATGTVTLAVWLTGGGSTAVVTSSLYFLVVVHAFFSHARPIAALHAALALMCWLVVLHGNSSIGTSEMVTLIGAAAAIAIVTAGLVREADLAEIDFTTGLLNRHGLERAAQKLLDAPASYRPLSLAMIDIDDYRATVAARGRGTGEDLLLDLARTWTPLLPEDALLARTGGDEFLLMCPDLDEHGARDLLATLAAASAPVTFSAGLAWACEGESLSSWLYRADAAVYEAKGLGPAQIALANAPHETDDGRDIVEALAADQFVLYYQPIVNVDTGVVVKAEALIRWLHPERGMVPPDEFIRRAEQCSAIYSLGDWILRTACSAAAGWGPNELGQPVPVTVNASGAELQDPTYPDRVRSALQQACLSPQRLIIELVETDYNTTSEVLADNLTQLTLMGIKLAIDDFGTGYSSLNRLQALQVDIIKIDRSFISEINQRDQSVPLITAIIAMAEAMTLEVVAEGIETEEQAAWLSRRGCTHAQGYFFGKPAPGEPQVTGRPVPPELRLETGLTARGPGRDTRRDEAVAS